MLVVFICILLEKIPDILEFGYFDNHIVRNIWNVLGNIRNFEKIMGYCDLPEIFGIY